MVDTVFATKRSMTQAWTTQGKRVAITKVHVEPNAVVAVETVSVRPSRTQDKQPTKVLEVGYGHKKLANMTKPLRTKLEKSGFSFGVKQMAGIRVAEDSEIKAGDVITVEQVLEVGDVVKVQGTSKGHGFAGGMKRHGFHGGPRTHGQSDRARAVGSIGAGTDPGRVLKGKKMPGHYGVETKTVHGLVVAHIDADTNEVWLSGPVPGHLKSIVTITKTGAKKSFELDKQASNITEPAPAEAEKADSTEAPAEDAPATQEETK